MTFALDHPSLVVFSHPNHELAIFGLLQRLKPSLIFLTDGGGEKRVAETRKGLESLGLLDRAVFLDHTEDSFYDALLRMDSFFFRQVAAELRDILKEKKPEQILVDSVEFYNPVHDIALPILSHADDVWWDGIFEVPLIYQKPGPKESYGIQTVPDAQTNRIEIDLTPAESASKEYALQNIYTILRDTMGPLLLSSPTALRKETLFPASTPLRWPDEGRVLRYNRRAAELQSAGKIKDKIIHEIHFVTVVSSLLGLDNA